jgi:hypothetical protein
MPSHQIVFSNRLAPGVSSPLGAHAETLVRVGEQARVYRRLTAVLFRRKDGKRMCSVVEHWLRLVRFTLIAVGNKVESNHPVRGALATLAL